MKLRIGKLLAFESTGYYITARIFGLNVMMTNDMLRVGRYVVIKEHDTKQDNTPRIEEGMWR